MNKKIKHLEFIENTITRMADCSFKLKGWAVTIVSFIFVLGFNKSAQIAVYFVLIPIIFLWFLDSYYLMQERAYRKLYDEIRENNKDNIDFSMKPTFDNCIIQNFLNSLLSFTELLFYLGLILSCYVIKFLI